MKLNDITIKNRFPVPIIEEILDELEGAKYFTKLDMRLGYHQVRMLPEDEYKTTFKTHHGYYQFKVKYNRSRIFIVNHKDFHSTKSRALATRYILFWLLACSDIKGH